MSSIEWCHFNDLDRPLNRFSKSQHFYVKYVEKTVHFRNKVTMEHY